jgi:demethylmenaquinone methyltransferase/2-methoxy-6-polyprenyl-1,4-benzoquinol methylase
MQNPAKVRGIFSSIAERYDLANHLLSGGLDFLWRSRAVRMVEKWHPHSVLDLATGSGDLALAMQKAMPQAHIIGADFCLPMLQIAARKNLSPLVVADGTNLPFADNSFDAVTVAFGLRNMGDYPLGLQEMRRVLKPGGHLFILDFSQPEAPLCYPYRLYLHHVLPKLAGLLTGQTDAYEYLGTSIEQFPSGKEMIALLAANGYGNASATPMTFGVVTAYEAVKM